MSRRSRASETIEILLEQDEEALLWHDGLTGQGLQDALAHLRAQYEILDWEGLELIYATRRDAEEMEDDG